MRHEVNRRFISIVLSLCLIAVIGFVFARSQKNNNDYHSYVTADNLKKMLARSDLNIEYKTVKPPVGADAVVAGIVDLANRKDERRDQVGFAYVLTKKGIDNTKVNSKQLAQVGLQIAPAGFTPRSVVHHQFIHGTLANVTYVTYNFKAYHRFEIIRQLDAALFSAFPKNDPEVFPILTKP